MQKWRAVVVTVAIAATVSAGQALNAEAGSKVRNPQEQCRTSEGNGWSDRDVKQAIRCATSRWHVPGGYRKARSVAGCESSFDEHNYYAGHGGGFQHAIRYWPARFRKWRVHGWRLHSSIYNARSNVVISIRMVHAVGWSPWSCA